MKKKFHPLIWASALAFALVACSSSVSVPGDNSVTINSSASAERLVTRQVQVRSFSGIEASHAIRVEFTEKRSGSPELTVTAPEDCIDHLKTEVKNGELRVYYDFDGGRHNTKGTLVRVSAPAVKRVAAQSAAEVVLTDGMHTRDNLKVELSSAARFAWRGTLRVDGLTNFDGSSAAKFEGESLVGKNVQVVLSSAAEGTLKGIKTEGVEAVTSSAANLKLEGQTRIARLTASSGSTLKAGALTAALTEADGSSGATLQAPRSEQLNYGESSGGRVSWKGSPRVTRR